MKAKFLLVLLTAGISGCASKPVATTREQRANPTQAAAYGNFVSQRTEELQRLGGPFKDRAAASAKAEEEAQSHFGGVPADTVTTTWTSSKAASKAQAQADFTDALDAQAKGAKDR